MTKYTEKDYMDMLQRCIDSGKNISFTYVEEVEQNDDDNEICNGNVVHEIKEELGKELESSTVLSNDKNLQLNLTDHKTIEIENETENEVEYPIDITDEFAKVKQENERSDEETQSADESTEKIAQTRKRRICKIVAAERIKRCSKKKKPKGLDQESNGQVNPFVYTTRLEDMKILRNTFTHLDKARVFKEILKESKPSYEIRSQNVIYSSKSKKRKKLSLSKLRKVLSNLKSTRSISVRTKSSLRNLKSTRSISVRPKSSLGNLKSTRSISVRPKTLLKKLKSTRSISVHRKSSLRNLKLTRSISARPKSSDNIQTNVNVHKEGDPIDCSNRTKDAVILINNVNSNLSDVYVTDSEGRIYEYYTGKSDEDHIKDVFEKFNSCKMKITLKVCCWYHRRNEIGVIFPNASNSFSLFVKSTHACPPADCNCCCKLKVTKDSLSDKRKAEFMLSLEQLNTIQQTKKIDRSSFSKKYTSNGNDNIIKMALCNKYVNRDTSAVKNVSHSSPVSQARTNNFNNFLIRYEFDYARQRPKRSEFIEVGKHDKTILSQTTYCLRGSSNVSRIEVCCRIKLNTFLLDIYKKSMISTGTFQYLKIPIPLKICQNCNAISKKVSCLQPSNFKISLPDVRHTRQMIKCTLRQTEQTDRTLSDQNVDNTFKQESNQTLKSPHTTVDQMPNEAIKTVNKTTLLSQHSVPKKVTLTVTCVEIPSVEISIRKLDYNLAVQFVIQLSATNVILRENKELVASFITSVESASALNILSDMLKVLQRYIYAVSLSQPWVQLSTGTKLNLIIKMQNIDNIETGIEQYAGPNNASSVEYCIDIAPSDKTIDQQNINNQNLVTNIPSNTNCNIINGPLTKNSVNQQTHCLLNSANKTNKQSNTNCIVINETFTTESVNEQSQCVITKVNKSNKPTNSNYNVINAPFTKDSVNQQPHRVITNTNKINQPSNTNYNVINAPFIKDSVNQQPHRVITNANKTNKPSNTNYNVINGPVTNESVNQQLQCVMTSAKKSTVTACNPNVKPTGTDINSSSSKFDKNRTQKTTKPSNESSIVLHEFEDDIPYTIVERNSKLITKICNKDGESNNYIRNTIDADIRDLERRKIFDRISNSLNTNKYSYEKSFSSYIISSTISKENHECHNINEIPTPRISNVFSLNTTNSNKNQPSITSEDNIIPSQNVGPDNFPRDRPSILATILNNTEIANTNDVNLRLADQVQQKSQLNAKILDLISDIPESSDFDDVINIADDMFVKEESDVVVLDSE